MTTLRWGTATDLGRVRTNNEDRLLARGGLFAVADGMGGHAGGEVAAEVALTVLDRVVGPALAEPARLVDAVKAANRAVWERAQADGRLRGMGTTVTALAPLPRRPGHGSEAVVANVGDSRSYRLRDGTLSLLTTDHSLAEAMVQQGELTARQAASHPSRHILTRVLGVEPDVEVDHWVVDVRDGDRYLLCSDGLVNEADEEEIASLLVEEHDPRAAAEALVRLARAHGGSDNITVVVLDATDEARPRGNPKEVAVEGPAGMGPAGQPGGPPTARPRPAQAGRRVAPTRMRPVTLRVVAFVVIFLVVVAGAFASIDWYAHHSYVVVLKGRRVVIERGEPGGFLWLSPEVVAVTTLRRDQVPPASLPALEAGMKEPSLAAASRFVGNLRSEWKALHPTTTTRVTTTTTTTTGAASNGGG